MKLLLTLAISAVILSGCCTQAQCQEADHEGQILYHPAISADGTYTNARIEHFNRHTPVSSSRVTRHTVLTEFGPVVVELGISLNVANNGYGGTEDILRVISLPDGVIAEPMEVVTPELENEFITLYPSYGF